ncbi:uncharacterized protein BDZ99DRAFT_263650 [Mytilinidion resinicola]|uniref:C2H2 type master regulator of conidiophore development brlA n=1 Tax=Mytilinidion resinicola TaxID=574789 RepID=A0A6A6YUQ6_9PEZI|nr:uncharacterized protein BDZ99DRAFT_263650 [Mytilinidion resinicola]KAF2812259.1 hypothetical protein BDZ99DRAFT_263650 [Mytilinidion resinicola]
MDDYLEFLGQSLVPRPGTVVCQPPSHNSYGLFDDFEGFPFSSSQESSGSGFDSSTTESLWLESDSAFRDATLGSAPISSIDTVTDRPFDARDVSWQQHVEVPMGRPDMPMNSFSRHPNGVLYTALKQPPEFQSSLTDGFDLSFETSSDLHLDLGASKHPISFHAKISTMQPTAEATSAVLIADNQAIDPSTHTGPFHCTEIECGAIFPRHKSFLQHLKTHQKPYKCAHETCPWAFRLRKDLIRHQKTHSISSAPGMQIRLGTFFYCRHAGCPSSQKGFSRRDNLLRHYRNHHDDKTEAGEENNELRRRSTRQKGWLSNGGSSETTN